MTTRSQKRKAVAELVSGDFEISVTENFPPETLVASSSKISRIESENLAEIKTSLRKEIMSDLTKILAENQKEMLKLIAPLNKKQNVLINAQDSDSETENVSVARTSTPVKIHNTTNSKATPINSRNMKKVESYCFLVIFELILAALFRFHSYGFDAIAHAGSKGTSECRMTLQNLMEVV